MSMTVRPQTPLRVVKPAQATAAAKPAATETPLPKASLAQAPTPVKPNPDVVKAQGAVGKAGWLIGGIGGGLLGGYAGFLGGSAVAGVLAFLGVATFPIIAIPTIALGAAGAFLGGSVLGGSGLLVDWLIPNKKTP